MIPVHGRRGDLAKDRKNANYKIYDYYQRNGKSFVEDRNDIYLRQWTRDLETLGRQYVMSPFREYKVVIKR